MTPSMIASYAPIPPCPERGLNPPDDPAPEFERIERCAVCQATGYFFDDRWFDSDDCITELIRAADTPDGKWVCRASCYSQQMYQAASPEDKARLNAIADALLSVNENMTHETREYIDRWLLNAPVNKSDVTAVEFNRDAMRLSRDLSQDSEPSWLDRPRREETLAAAIEDACIALDLHPIIELTSWTATLRTMTDRHVTFSREYLIEKSERLTTAVSGIIRRLREAVGQ